VIVAAIGLAIVIGDWRGPSWHLRAGAKPPFEVIPLPNWSPKLSSDWRRPARHRRAGAKPPFELTVLTARPDTGKIHGFKSIPFAAVYRPRNRLDINHWYQFVIEVIRKETGEIVRTKVYSPYSLGTEPLWFSDHRADLPVPPGEYTVRWHLRDLGDGKVDVTKWPRDPLPLASGTTKGQGCLIPAIPLRKRLPVSNLSQ
jgi:hypothetical protein